MHPRPLQALFRLYVQFLADAGLPGKTTIGIDGSKLKAVNSKKNNYNQNKIDKHRRFIEDKTARYLQQLDELDKQQAAAEGTDDPCNKKRKDSPGACPT